MGEAMRFQKETTLWQGGLSGVYLLTFLFALVFFLRLHDPLIGWYALFVFINANWFLDRSGYLIDFLGQDSWYARMRPYYPMPLIFTALWSIFLIKFIQLWKYSKFLYFLILTWISLNFVDYLVSIFIGVTGQFYTPFRILLHWIGIEYIGYVAINLLFLLISIIYVSIKDFRTVRWYALAFSIGLISMIIALLALFDIAWLPFYLSTIYTLSAH